MPRNFQPWAILPVLVIATAFILSFFCIFAGDSPGFLQEYYVFNLNTTRFGQNAVQKIDDKIMGLNVSRILTKRDLVPEIPMMLDVNIGAPMTAPPVPHPTLAPRSPDGIDDFVDNISDGIASIKSEAGGVITSVKDGIESKATAVASAVESKASSVEGIVVSKISSAVASIQTAVIEQVNETYSDFLSTLDLDGFYSVHLVTTCSGEYVTPQGVNITIGSSPLPPNGTHKIIEECKDHSSLNPLSLVRVLFAFGIFFAGLCLLTSVWATFSFSRTKAILNAVLCIPALGFFALGSAATHGIATASVALINVLGDDVGLKANVGKKLLALVWATTILVLVCACLWTILCFTGDHLPTNFKRSGSRSGGYVDEKNSRGLPQHEMKNVHPGEQRGPTGHSDVAAWAAAGAHRGHSGPHNAEQGQQQTSQPQSEQARKFAKKNSWYVRG
ncbi:hypothetical protein CERZMDRAFT_46172 [Cercospora zeae-maydis SCOH1-5]|uniref:Actin cortical patch SUR7/pH-response regulator PalI n=1 Tax=Cercospora zeae-maydis SCOH1-5 TaxID=717836 RepID=A0A6A6F9F2_9PEZI|nr:hypothetical protein CERZMDRAFT_46172 [Cercospora zeae-maydis SCOH1-5]